VGGLEAGEEGGFDFFERDIGQVDARPAEHFDQRAGDFTRGLGACARIASRVSGEMTVKAGVIGAPGHAGKASMRYFRRVGVIGFVIFLV